MGAKAGGVVRQCASVNGGIFSKDIMAADDEGSWFSLVFKILGLCADSGEGVELVLAAYFTVALKDDVGVKFTAVA